MSTSHRRVSSTVRKVIGLHGSAVGWFLATEVQDARRALIVCADRREVDELIDDLHFFRGESGVSVFPSWETLPLEPVSPGVEVSAQRIKALKEIVYGERFIAVTSADALLQKILPPDYIPRLSTTLRVGDELDREKLVTTLLDGGFTPAKSVTEIGDLCVKGSVIDIFPGTSPHPVRL